MPNSNFKYLIALTHFPKFGPVRLKKLKKFFPDLSQVFKSSARDLIKAGLNENVAHEFIAARSELKPDIIIEKMNQEKINVLMIEDDAYPGLLAEIYDPPQLFFYKGELSKNDKFSLAVVGTRKYTPYGKRAAENIVFDLAKNNLTIVSGLAYGIDALSHDAALKANGRTIAVLGSGLDKQSIYPSANRYLADKIIASGGLIISEFPLGTPPLKHHFPQRNRIISGLSLGTLVIEAAEKSGSLITANQALEQNREVFALPGSIYSETSKGPNNLIKQGAKTVTCAEDVIEALDLAKINTYISIEKIAPETKEEELVLSYLSQETIHINELVRLTKLDTSTISSTLVIMEMKGMIKNLGNMEYVLAR
ncbi:MAG: DNA-processing protein DprA [Patescibacteria group bacterium]|nr:DNA-processing protein DprA [Patescibacteria group bacterium]